MEGRLKKMMETEMKKPKGCIYPDCLNCPFDDCQYDGLEPEDFAESSRMDMEAELFKNPFYLQQKESSRKYEQSRKGKERRKRYEQSEKGRARQARYERSEKAKERHKRYYERHKEEILAKRRE